jgi:hypothetical protein
MSSCTSCRCVLLRDWPLGCRAPRWPDFFDTFHILVHPGYASITSPHRDAVRIVRSGLNLRRVMRLLARSERALLYRIVTGARRRRSWPDRRDAVAVALQCFSFLSIMVCCTEAILLLGLAGWCGRI